MSARTSPQPFAKRALDLALLTATAPLFVPLTAALALVVLAVDGRPVLFRQERVGLLRAPFRILKLRTMTMEEDVAARTPTKLGAVLRRHGLDELPQLLNVWRGDMSLVGPRPLTPADADRLVARHPPFAARFGAKPGLTGLSQVHHTRGIADTAVLDERYTRVQSAAVDLRVLVRTAWINIVGKARGKLPLP